MRMYFESVNKRNISESSQAGYHFSHIFISETTIIVDQLCTRARSEADWRPRTKPATNDPDTMATAGSDVELKQKIINNLFGTKMNLFLNHFRSFQ